MFIPSNTADADADAEGSPHGGLSFLGCAERSDAVDRTRAQTQTAEEITGVGDGGTGASSWRCFEWAEDSSCAVVQSESLR